MRKYIFLSFSFLFIIPSVCFSQKDKKQNSNFFLQAGYGLAGSFFVRSYTEFAPLPTYKAFYKKHFVGVSQNAAVGVNLKKNWEMRFGINYQHFTRRVKSQDTLYNVHINLNHDIHHRDYMWFGSIAKKLENKNHLFIFGLGLYYLRAKMEEVEIYYPNYFADTEPEFKYSKEEEGGAFVEFAYEYKFQPKVNLGVKTQFYYTISTASAESITLFPYVKILF